RQLVQRSDQGIGAWAMSLQRRSVAVHPEARKSKGLAASDIPAIGRYETNTNGQELQVVDRELVHARAWLVHVDRIDGQDSVEVPSDARCRGKWLQHPTRSVRQDHPPQWSERLQRRSGVWKEAQVEIGIEKAVSGRRGERHRQRLGCILQRVRGDRREVFT